VKRSWIPSGAIAIAAHLGALLALHPVEPRAFPPTPTAPVAPQDSLLDAIEVEPLRNALVPSPSPSPVAEPGSRETTPHPRGAKLAGERAPAEPGPAGELLPARRSEPPAQPQGPATDDGWSFNPSTTPELTRPDAITRAVRGGGTRGQGGENGSETEPTGVSKTGGLVEGLDAHDAALGMGRGGGAVVSALELAARDDPSFIEGTATFDVGIDTSGHVTVALLNASNAAGAWTHVGEAMRGSLDPKVIRIPPGAPGWHVVATVEANVQYPNGADPKKMGTRFIAKPPRIIENKHRATIGDPPIIIEGPVLALEHTGKVCGIRLELGTTPISGYCDPTNIGMNALRVVRSHVVSEGRL
jgi:hypothetical protein